MSTAPITTETERPAGADDGRFSAAVAAVAAAFGDPTRRDIFLHVRAAPGVTAGEVATTFSLHPNVARHHLQRLVDGGYLRVETARNAHQCDMISTTEPVSESRPCPVCGQRMKLLTT